MLKSGVFIFLLTILEAKTSLPLIGSDDLCSSNEPCKCVSTLPITFCQGVNLSPFYTVAATSSPSTQNVDNVCTTFFPFDQCTFLTFTVTTFSNGSLQIAATFSSQFPKQKGVIRVQGNNDISGGESIVYNQLFYAQPCENIFVSYTCYLFGGCSTLQAQQQYGDQLSAYSTTPYISPICFWRVQTLGVTQFASNEWLQYPYKLLPSCVASFNGASCINVESIPEEYQICVPSLTDAAIQATLASPFSIINPALSTIYSALGPNPTMDQVNAATAQYKDAITQNFAS